MKTEYPPLLTPGLQQITLAELKILCVDNFPSSASRSNLFANFEKLVSQLQTNTITCELWVDGSFLTQKVDPKDIDLTVKLKYADFFGFTAQQKALVAQIEANLKNMLSIDSYIFFEYPSTHPHYALGQTMRAYWLRQWGFSRSGADKGIAALSLP